MQVTAVCVPLFNITCFSLSHSVGCCITDLHVWKVQRELFHHVLLKYQNNNGYTVLTDTSIYLGRSCCCCYWEFVSKPKIQRQPKIQRKPKIQQYTEISVLKQKYNKTSPDCHWNETVNYTQIQSIIIFT